MTNIDMSKTVVPKSDQMNADDLISGPVTLTITAISATESSDQPISISFDGDNNRPYKPCKSMRRVMIACWGNKGQDYVGNSMTLFNDPTVKWAGKDIGGIRISHMSHIPAEKEVLLTTTRGARKPYLVQPLIMASPDDIQAGEEAANKGSEAYKSWLSNLPDDVKKTIKPFHKSFSAIAVNFDKSQLENDQPENKSTQI